MKEQNVLPVGVVYPSEQISVWVDPTTGHGGAHKYAVLKYLEHRDGEPAYTDGEINFISFAYRGEDGTAQSGLLSEQLLLILLDRHEKLNAAYPSPLYEKFRAGICMALEALEERVKDRINRGVIGLPRP